MKEIITGDIKEFPITETITEIIIEDITTSGMTGITEGIIIPTEASLRFPAAGIIITEQSGTRIL